MKNQVLSAFLKSVAERELRQPGISDDVGDLPKPRAFDVGDQRFVEYRVIPDVEQIGRELEILLLGERPGFAERRVPILLEGTAKRIAPQRSETRGSVDSDDGRRDERRGI